MAYKSSDRIRQEFFDFFSEKGHLIVKSAPVVPEDDPTLLFTNAGMNQFKPVFLGEKQGYEADGKVWKRVANSQRCIRVSGKHNDLEEVGHDTYHHTLFEMLGNWSFGDYFKKEAIRWAWELLVERWGLEPDRLYATVFEGDEGDGLPFDQESADFWKSETGIPHDHILGFSRKDNFWEMGETGPCGSCSEIHVDMRPDDERHRVNGADLVNRNDPRVIEIWNLVFIEFDRKNDGSLEKLPAQHVDTGMGFERICAALQGKLSNYETDIFTRLINKVAVTAGESYGSDTDRDIAMRVIADHIRAVSFAITDGASPSNDGRGFVIRRILRRAVRYGWDKLGFKEPFLYKLVPVLADQFLDVFPELDARRDYVTDVIRSEEQSFLDTLGQGIELFNRITGSGKTLSGEDAFKLHDTYGFPIDLTQLMAREKGISVDTETFTSLMNRQKERARAAGRFRMSERDQKEWRVVGGGDGFEFVGYDHLSCEVSVRAAAVVPDDGQPVTGDREKSVQDDDTDSETDRKTDKNAAGILLLDRSPFYAESGGQVADTGLLKKNGVTLNVLDVQKGPEGFFHYVDRLPRDLTGTWEAVVDRDRRLEIQKHHTATHLLHAALRDVLGEHITQKGSLVDVDRLRFDFSHYEALSPDQLNGLEQFVNEKIQENIPKTEERKVSLEEARKRGAMMLFGEKYGDRVRVITFGEDFSVELCGGTHAGATGELGYFRFLSESSSATGIRRIEAVTGRRSVRVLLEEKQLIEGVRRLTGRRGDVVSGIGEILEERKKLEKELLKYERKQASGVLDELMGRPETIGKFKLISGEIAGMDMDMLKQVGYDALEKTGSGTVIVLGSVNPDEKKVYLVAAVTPDLIEKGLKAGDLVGRLGKIVGGGGGGQPALATAGGRFPEKLGEALKAAESWLKESG